MSRLFACTPSHSHCQSLVASPSLCPHHRNFIWTFLRIHHNPMQPNPFSIIEIIQWLPVLECLQTICNCCLPVQGSVSKLFRMVLPLDNGLMLLLHIPSHPFFLPLVERTVVGLSHPFGKLLEGEFSLLQADWGFAHCTAQLR